MVYWYSTGNITSKTITTSDVQNSDGTDCVGKVYTFLTGVKTLTGGNDSRYSNKVYSGGPRGIGANDQFGQRNGSSATSVGRMRSYISSTFSLRLKLNVTRANQIQPMYAYIPEYQAWSPYESEYTSTTDYNSWNDQDALQEMTGTAALNDVAGKTNYHETYYVDKYGLIQRQYHLKQKQTLNFIYCQDVPVGQSSRTTQTSVESKMQNHIKRWFLRKGVNYSTTKQTKLSDTVTRNTYPRINIEGNDSSDSTAVRLNPDYFITPVREMTKFRLTHDGDIELRIPLNCTAYTQKSLPVGLSFGNLRFLIPIYGINCQITLKSARIHGFRLYNFTADDFQASNSDRASTSNYGCMLASNRLIGGQSGTFDYKFMNVGGNDSTWYGPYDNITLSWQVPKVKKKCYIFYPNASYYEVQISSDEDFKDIKYTAYIWDHQTQDTKTWDCTARDFMSEASWASINVSKATYYLRMRVIDELGNDDHANNIFTEYFKANFGKNGCRSKLSQPRFSSSKRQESTPYSNTIKINIDYTLASIASETFKLSSTNLTIGQTVIASCEVVDLPTAVRARPKSATFHFMYGQTKGQYKMDIIRTVEIPERTNSSTFFVSASYTIPSFIRPRYGYLRVFCKLDPPDGYNKYDPGITSPTIYATVNCGLKAPRGIQITNIDGSSVTSSVVNSSTGFKIKWQPVVSGLINVLHSYYIYQHCYDTYQAAQKAAALSDENFKQMATQIFEIDSGYSEYTISNPLTGYLVFKLQSMGSITGSDLSNAFILKSQMGASGNYYLGNNKWARCIVKYCDNAGKWNDCIIMRLQQGVWVPYTN